MIECCHARGPVISFIPINARLTFTDVLLVKLASVVKEKFKLRVYGSLSLMPPLALQRTIVSKAI